MQPAPHLHSADTCAAFALPSVSPVPVCARRRTRDRPRASMSLRSLISQAQSPLPFRRTPIARPAKKHSCAPKTLRIYSPEPVLRCLDIPMTTHLDTMLPHTTALPPPPVLLLLPPPHALDPLPVPDPDPDLALRATAQTARFKILFAQSGYGTTGVRSLWRILLIAFPDQSQNPPHPRRLMSFHQHPAFRRPCPLRPRPPLIPTRFAHVSSHALFSPSLCSRFRA